MVNNSRCLHVKLWMFFSVIFSLACSKCWSIQCDLTKQYPLGDGTGNKTLRCMPCKTCKPGKEPEIPCGTTIGRYEQVGNCRRCKNGTYSAKEDTGPCQVCRSENCFEHQVIEGTCLADQRDETYCLDKCDNGYGMNKDRTACEVLTPLQNTTEKPTSSNPATSDPATLKPRTISDLTTMTPTANTNTTTKLVLLNNQKDAMNVPIWAKILIAIVVLVIFIVIIYKFLWPLWKKTQATERPDEKCEDEELLDVSVGEQQKIITQEESRETGSPEANGTPHSCPETSGEFVDSTQNVSAPQGVSSIADDINMGYASTPPTGNNLVALDMQVQSPAQMPFNGALRQPEEMVYIRQLPFSPNPISPPIHNIDHLNSTGFDRYPLNLYNKVCNTFDTGPPGQDATDLACWLSITVSQNRAFEKKGNKADLIIQTWMGRRGNTVAKFVEILNDHGMTNLVDEIDAY